MRVSTDKQTLDNQKHKILEYAYNNDIKVEKFIEIEVSSRKEQKVRLIEELFEQLEEGDTLIVTELSRLGRNMLEILNLIERFNEANIKVVFVNQPELSTADNALSKLLYSIYGYFAETEREIISERTKAGIAVARASGKLIGRQKGQLVKSQYDTHRDKIEELYALGLGVQKIVNHIGIGTQPSLRKYIKSRKIKGT
ncbi:recombinase family protein [Candidatus Sulfurimonas marisnigri]|uniref:recombinase family protein n=1 Tax=Candidatus Sulfurimonas marisnigri TaxID=2740405 RepID=UPI00227D7CA9|nr:recombinase family protein [Candidatus Sulfurimonas marisnigri]